MRIAVLAGGRTPERDVSLRSGHRISNALGELSHEALLLDPAEVQLAETLREVRPDVCYLTLHGKEGEDGTVQRLLDLLRIPYTGTRAFQCEVAFDKVLAKDALAAAGVSTPAWAVMEGSALRDLGAGSVLAEAADHVGLPCVVKPSRSGSALGVAFVERQQDLPAAVMAALSFSDAAIIESRVVGTELASGYAGSPLEPLPLVEIHSKNGVFDYAARYTAGAAEYFAPARLDPAATDRCLEEATGAVLALGLQGVARVDVIQDAAGVPWVLEVNVAPGMTETSLLPMAAQATGISMADLCQRVLTAASG